MAKGRRSTSIQSDRILGLGNYNYNHGRHHDESEFGEEEVWSMVEDLRDHHGRHQNQRGAYGGEWNPRATTESGRARRAEPHVGGLSLAFDQETTTSSSRIMHQFSGNGGGPRGGRHVATSAPVNVPDWSKILRGHSAESMHDSDEDDRVGDSGMEPPHEYLARSRQMNAMSVFEGVGRTLKGRDMSRVRDAVWSQTGFEG